MKIDKKTINTLCSMPDDKLWATVRLFASSSGIALAPRPASPRDMAKLRRCLSQLTEADISRAGEIMRNFKNQR